MSIISHSTAFTATRGSEESGISFRGRLAWACQLASGARWLASVDLGSLRWKCAMMSPTEMPPKMTSSLVEPIEPLMTWMKFGAGLTKQRRRSYLYQISSKYMLNISWTISMSCWTYSTTQMTMNGLLDFSDFSVFVGSSFLFMWKIKVEGRNFQMRFPKFATPTFSLLLDVMLRICPLAIFRFMLRVPWFIIPMRNRYRWNTISFRLMGAITIKQHITNKFNKSQKSTGNFSAVWSTRPMLPSIVRMTRRTSIAAPKLLLPLKMLLMQILYERPKTSRRTSTTPRRMFTWRQQIQRDKSGHVVNKS